MSCCRKKQNCESKTVHAKQGEVVFYDKDGYYQGNSEPKIECAKTEPVNWRQKYQDKCLEFLEENQRWNRRMSELVECFECAKAEWILENESRLIQGLERKLEEIDATFNKNLENCYEESYKILLEQNQKISELEARLAQYESDK